MKWRPLGWLLSRVTQRDIDATTPVENAFADHVKRRWDEESARAIDASGGVNRAPGLGPGLLNQGPAGVGDAMREMSAAPVRRRAIRSAPEPLLVIHPNSFPGDEMCQQLNDRGYSILIAPPGDVRLFGDPSQVFTQADVDLCREFAKLDEADTDHAKLMKVAAESLAKRIEDALLDGAP